MIARSSHPKAAACCCEARRGCGMWRRDNETCNVVSPDRQKLPVMSLAAHASRRSRRSLLSMRLLCFNELDLILRGSPTGRANARPMTGSVAVSKDGLQYRFVIPGTRVNIEAQVVVETLFRSINRLRFWPAPVKSRHAFNHRHFGPDCRTASYR